MTGAGHVATVLLYAEDARGLGHVNRSLTVARHLLAANRQAAAVLVTGSSVPEVFALPPRCDVIKLPAHRPWVAPGQTDEEMTAARLQLQGAHRELRQRYRDLRRTLLTDIAVGLAPEVVVVDNEPLGFRDELREGLFALRERHPSSRFVFHMLDIPGDPAYIRDQWRKRGVYQALETLYDDVVVSGSPHLWDIAERYGLPDAVRSRLHYAGYILRDVDMRDEAAIRRCHGLSPSARVVVVTVGGGHAGYPALDASLEALEQIRSEYPDVESVLVTGPLQSPERFAALRARAGDGRQVIRQTDTYRLMLAADVIVTMSGYNSTAEALAAARPLVLIPQPPQGRHLMEQLLRASALAERGLARSVPLQSITPSQLADAIRWALGCDREEYTRRIRSLGLSFDGAAWLARHLSPYLAGG